MTFDPVKIGYFYRVKGHIVRTRRGRAWEQGYVTAFATLFSVTVYTCASYNFIPSKLRHQILWFEGRERQPLLESM